MHTFLTLGLDEGELATSLDAVLQGKSFRTRNRYISWKTQNQRSFRKIFPNAENYKDREGAVLRSGKCIGVLFSVILYFVYSKKVSKNHVIRNIRKKSDS